MLKYVIQKVPSRDVSHILAELPEAIVYEDPHRNPMRAFLATMRIGFNGPHVHLEDDIDLAPNFRQKIEAAIAQYPDKMISFFTLRKIEKTTTMPGRNFCMAQCFYMPAGFPEMVVDFYSRGWKREAQSPNALDYMVADALAEQKLSYMIWVPNLVQHRVCVSEINASRSKFRQSKVFDGGQ